MFQEIANSIIQFTNDYKVILTVLAIAMIFIASTIHMFGTQNMKAVGKGMWVAVGVSLLVIGIANAAVNYIDTTFKF